MRYFGRDGRAGGCQIHLDERRTDLQFLSLRRVGGRRGGLWDVPAMADEMRRNGKDMRVEGRVEGDGDVGG